MIAGMLIYGVWNKIGQKMYRLFGLSEDKKYTELEIQI